MIEEGRKALERAEIAGRAFADYNREQVMRIVRAVAAAAEENAERLAQEAVRETGLGVVADKVTKNLAIARHFVSESGHLDFCGHRVDVGAKVVSVPKPPGVVLAVIPSTSPVAALYFKVLCALLTRNAVVVSPHPLAAQTGVEATRVLAAAATSAGAPADVIQVLPKPTIPLVEAMMADKRTKLVLATGGGPVVQAAYRSGTPAIGVGPGNPPVVVDETADLANAAASIVDSKVFDHSVLCTAESVLLQVGSVASTLQAHLEQNGAYVCSPAETQKIRSFMYPGGKFNTKVVGRSAADIARSASIRVPQTARILVTPINRVAEDEPLTHEKLSPVLAMRTVSDFAQAIREARALSSTARTRNGCWTSRPQCRCTGSRSTPLGAWAMPESAPAFRSRCRWARVSSVAARPPITSAPSISSSGAGPRTHRTRLFHSLTSAISRPVLPPRDEASMVRPATSPRTKCKR
jgi:acyl-CoA reductase-like NAD-dependent aldehyde dehydrogenase